MPKRTCVNGHITKDDKALKCSQCGADLPPPPKKSKLPIVIGVIVVLLLCAIIAIANSGKKGQVASTSPSPVAVAQASGAPQSTTAKATAALNPTSAPVATPNPTVPAQPSKAPTLVPSPVMLSGTGQTATQPFTLPSAVSVAHFTHAGSRNFVVQVYQGDKKDLLINTIGRYDGVRPLAGTGQFYLNIEADGAWAVRIDPISDGGSPEFQGAGDGVSKLFSPPAAGPWEIRHDGTRNFAVYCRCTGGSKLVQNEIGPVSGSQMITFPSGPCFWEVQADGVWSLKPR